MGHLTNAQNIFTIDAIMHTHTQADAHRRKADTLGFPGSPANDVIPIIPKHEAVTVEITVIIT